MKRQKEYSNYKYKDFINDDTFIEFALKKADIKDSIWNGWPEKYPDNKDDYSNALQTIQILGLGVKRKPDFDISNELRKLQVKIKQFESRNNNTIFIRKIYKNWYKIAATIALMIMLSLGFYYVSQRKNFQHFSTFEGQKKEIVLDDGTKIWLNSFSKLEFPKNFKKNKREIQLQGEAYFEVAVKDPQPFIVHTKNSIVKVVGTLFNINSNTYDSSIVVTVLSGKVEFYENKNEANKIVLEKNSAGILALNKTTPLKMINNNMNFLAWKTGVLTFENDSLTKVISDLEKYYKKEIVFKDIVPDDYSLNVSFVNLSLEEVMNIVAGTFDFSFIIKNDKFYLYRNNKSD